MVLPSDCMENVPLELHEKFQPKYKWIVPAIIYVPVKFEFEQKSIVQGEIKKLTCE